MFLLLLGLLLLVILVRRNRRKTKPEPEITADSSEGESDSELGHMGSFHTLFGETSLSALQALPNVEEPFALEQSCSSEDK